MKERVLDMTAFNTHKENEKRNKVLVILSIILWLLLATTLIYLLFGLMGAKSSTLPTTNSSKISFQADANASENTLKAKADAIAALNQKVKDGEINISMNTNPVFANGQAKGTLMITNNTINKYPQMVEIYTKDNHTLVYSGGVEVGQKIETSNLAVNLSKGTYDCIAYFNAVDPTTGTKMGTAAANITITVQS
ncbi:hypothetical protein [Clostridium beijerinckii]|uniref:Uncharacterized protein n=2 Tax=Clostridium beijerinckii TaxID=1520 RepID=A0AAW3W6B8_CLOBE|nr:hypothetical protein [Clostridium beijerinckii]MBC2457154.1 hypothetical protein [Clostridium beijerinckii]MBC2474211.1 hypothetical protein [Clostridium beijerinckii]NOV58690.1 beta-glucosidase/6-phospho-beta-glucosidase/beta-galactosidase [Clostridium beijerinckii]NOV71925.1 beta-glucosidase/6-phospho-beta-glucosidase/beta-galactosidase [Clostridium beijerinckii]NOW32045.1 beta-glucosidase/6-phospho-beta-glucosidase/beta-galactosidase [Clostridium beijerinckii]